MLTHKNRWFPKWCDTVFCHPEHDFIPMPSFSSIEYRDNCGGHWSWPYSWPLPKRPLGKAYERSLGECLDTPKEHLSLTCLLIATIRYSFQTNLLPVNIMFFGIHVYHFFIPKAYTSCNVYTFFLTYAHLRINYPSAVKSCVIYF